MKREREAYLLNTVSGDIMQNTIQILRQADTESDNQRTGISEEI